MLKSMTTRLVGCWMIKVSMYGKSLCVVAFNTEDHQTYVNFFTDPNDVHEFIKRVLE